MKHFVILMFVFASSLLSANDNYQDTKNKDSEAREELIATNIRYLKGRIISKIQSAEAKLEKYKTGLKNSQNGAEVQIWLKKVHKTESSIKNLKEALMAFDFAENRFNQ
jgi:hypothetical protein